MSGSNVNIVNNVIVTCSNYTYTVGGTVTGVTGIGSYVVLQDSIGGTTSHISTDGTFTLPTPLASGSAYNVTVQTQPGGGLCSVSAGAGTVSGSNVGNITVVCALTANLHTVGGPISGLTGTLVLQDNNGDNLSIPAASTSFTFATSVATGSPYSVTVFNQPTGQNCSVGSGTGTIATIDITNVSVTCATNTYTIGGNVTGLSGSMVLQDNGTADTLNVLVNGSFTFASAIASGSMYDVTVLTPPGGQICTVSNGGPTAVVASNISNVAVACRNNITGGAKQGVPLTLTSTVSTFAGSGTTGLTDNTTGTLATFNNPRGITYDGTNLYVADTINNKIRMISPSGAVSTFAGSGLAGSADNATGTSATFDNPYGITSDGANLYVADTLNNKIRMINIATRAVTTLAGSGVAGSSEGTGSAAQFNNPHGITTDGTNVYVADTLNNKIRKIVINSGAVTTFAGSGTLGFTDNPTGTAATFNQPWGVTTDGTNLYVADTNNHTIRQIVISSPSGVTTLAGVAGSFGSANGSGTTAKFDFPRGITTDGTNLYVADSTSQLIRKVTIAGTVVTVSTLAGTGTSGAVDSSSTSASFYDPSGITTDGVSLFIADTSNKKIRKIN